MSNYIDNLISKTTWKDKDLIKKRIPIGFENFPQPLREVYIWHIQCMINADELSNELQEIKKILYEKEKNYFSSIEHVKKSADKIKNYFLDKNNKEKNNAIS
jgi:hypothetical protein